MKKNVKIYFVNINLRKENAKLENIPVRLLFDRCTELQLTLNHSTEIN